MQNKFNCPLALPSSGATRPIVQACWLSLLRPFSQPLAAKIQTFPILSKTFPTFSPTNELGRLISIFLRFYLEVSGLLLIFAAESIYYNDMQAIATTENVQLSLPNADLAFLRTISKKMGWSLKLQRKSGIDKGLEDVRKGNVYQAKNSEDLIKQILG